MKGKNMIAKRILISLLVMAVIAGCTIRIVTLNKQFPNPEIRQYGLNDSFVWEELEITAKGYRLLTVPEIQQYIEGFDVSYVDKQGNDKDERMLVAELQVSNPTDREKHFSTYLCSLRSGAYFQAFDPRYYSNFNAGASSADIGPGETVTVYLPFHIYSIHFSENAWEKLDTRTFEIVLSIYPVKEIITLT